MRDLIQVGMERRETAGQEERQGARLIDLRKDAESAAEAFVRYLTHYPPKTRRTRHGLLGPVAEIVKLASKPLMTPGQATGRAMRMHEMAQQGRALGSKAIELLEQATNEFFALADRCPVHLRKALRDRVLDHVYFETRKKQARFWEAFREWLKEKYKDVTVLNDSWKATFEDWANVRKNTSEASKQDFQAFRDSRETKGETIVPEDEAEGEDE